MDDSNTPRRLTAEDLTVGERTDIGSYTPSFDEIIGFAEQWDPQLFHIDVEVAEAGYFGGIIGSGLHSLSIFQRLSVLNLYREWEVIAGRRIHDIQFTTPLRPDVTVEGSVTVEAIVFTHAERALVTTRGELHTADGRPILTIVADSYVRRRLPATE